MGMDLVAAHKGVESFHANWFGWGLLRDLLTELGCDTSAMAGSNDGAVVDADTAMAWAAAIEMSLGDILVAEYEDASFENNVRIGFHVDGSATPVLVSTFQVSEDALAAVLGRSASAPAEPTRVVRLAERPVELKWVRSFARFCEESGGFAQY